MRSGTEQMQSRRKSGIASLRAGAEGGKEVVSKEPEALKRHAKVVYDWVLQSKSYVRMLSQYQAAGGGSFVANVYHTCMVAFLKHGNLKHTATSADNVSLDDFTAAVLHRHSNSMDGDHDGAAAPEYPDH